MDGAKKYKIGILSTHPVQYYAPWYRQLAKTSDLEVFFCHKQTAQDQANAGFDVAFEWDTPLLDGYNYSFLINKSRHPNVHSFFGCNTPQICQVIYKGSFDAFIVQGWNVYSFWQAIIACWKTRTPVMVRGDSNLGLCSGIVKKSLKYLFYRWFIPKFDAYLIVGKLNKEYYLHYGADKARMFFCPHCVDNDFFSNSKKILRDRKTSLRQRYGIPPGALVFLFAGKLISRKRPMDFLAALDLAVDKHKDIDLYGLIIGDGPLRPELESFSKRRDLPVVFAGFLNQRSMPEAYAASDVLVLCSKEKETWGLVVNEAMASMLPVIVSQESGCQPDLVYPGQNGEVFSSGDIKKLSDLIADFSLKRQYLEEMGKKSLEIIQEYSINRAQEGVLDAVIFTEKSRRLNSLNMP